MGANASTINGVMLILAAGLATRWGGKDKTALYWPEGGTLLAHQEKLAKSLGFSTLAVARAPSNEPPRIVNPEPQRGLASSLALGLRVARARFGAVPVGVLLADQPFVTKEDILTVYHAFMRRPATVHAVRPRYGGAPGHPVFFDPAWDARVLELSGDRGLGAIWDSASDTLWVEIGIQDRPHPAFDIDTEEAYDIARQWAE
jgi:molybdenum cofactor cytidylyltransferase